MTRNILEFRMKTNGVFTIWILVTMFIFPLLVSAQTTGSSSGTSLGSTTGGTEKIEFSNPLTQDTVEGVLTGAMTTIKNVVAALAVLMIVVGGVMYITSAGSNQTEAAKKTITFALVGLAITLAAPAFLKEVYEIVGTEDVPEGVGETGLYEIAVSATQTILTFIGALSILMIVVGGVMYITNQTDTAKKIIKFAIIGLVVALTSLVMVNAIVSVF